MHILDKLIIQDKEARSFGFEWPDYTFILQQIMNECREVQEDIQGNAPREKIQEEIGDLMHAALSLCLFMGFDSTDTLEKAYAKFGQRLMALREVARSQGFSDLRDMTPEKRFSLWYQAKILLEKD